MKWKTIPLAALWLGVALPVRAADQSPPTAVGLQEVGAKNINLLTIWCSPSYDASMIQVSGSAQCFFSSTTVRKPSPEDILEKLSELDSADGRKDVERSLSRCKDDVAAIQANADKVKALPLANQTFLAMFVDACSKKSASLLSAAMKYQINEIDAQTCKVHGHAAKSFVFKQTSDNSWEYIDGGPLGGTVVMTIWRDQGQYLWNYREARAGDVNCKVGDTFCRAPGNVEWRWDRGKPTLECKFVVEG